MKKERKKLIDAEYYKWIPWLILLVIIGLALKSRHYPGAGIIMVVGLGSLAGFSWFLAVQFIVKYKRLPFLRWFGAFANMVLVIVNIGFLFKMQHWPFGTVLDYLGTFLFVLSMIALVFTLPNSQFIEWTKIEKKVFYRAVVMPMLFIFTTIVLTHVFDVFTDIMQGKTTLEFGMDSIELFNLEGL